MLQMYKSYLTFPKKLILDKYLERKQYGDFTPLLYEIFQRRQYEFDLSQEEFEEEIKNFCRNVKKILFLRGRAAKDVMGNFQGAYFLNYPVIAINADATLNFSNGEPEYFNIREVFNILTHEVHHAISHREETYGVEKVNDRKAFGRCLNEIIVEMSSARVCKDITRPELTKTRQETNSYVEVTPLGHFLISAFGVSEKEFLKAGMKTRNHIVALIEKKFPPGYRNNVATLLEKYQTNLDILFNSLYHSPKEKLLTETSLSQVFDTGYEIARTQIQLDNRELTPQYISEINYRYNQMIQVQRENLMEYDSDVAQNVNLNVEYMQPQKKYFQKIVFDLNKLYSIKNIIRDPVVFNMLTGYARDGVLENGTLMLNYLYGIDLNRLYVPVSNQGELAVNWQSMNEVIHNEFDDGKRFGDATLLEPTYNLLKKAYRDKDKFDVFSSALHGTIKVEDEIKKIKYKVVNKIQRTKPHRKNKRRLSGVVNSREKMGGETMENKIVRGALAGRLKMDYLMVRLKILGYNSVKDLKQPLDDTKGYHSLGKIGYDLEHFVNLERVSGDAVDRYIEETREEIQFIANQEEFLDKVRGIYPDFALGMQEKVSPEDWEIYSQMVQKTGNLLTDLIVGKHNIDTPLAQSDLISELIDSPEFATACKIEDEFMKKEYEKFIEIAEEKGFDDEAVRQSSCAVLLASLVRTSQAVSNKKQKYIESYGEYQKFLDKLNGKSLTIKTDDGSKMKNGNEEKKSTRDTRDERV